MLNIEFINLQNLPHQKNWNKKKLAKIDKRSHYLKTYKIYLNSAYFATVRLINKT